MVKRHTCCSGGADLVTSSCLEEEASIALELLLLEIMVAEVDATDLLIFCSILYSDTLVPWVAVQ